MNTAFFITHKLASDHVLSNKNAISNTAVQESRPLLGNTKPKGIHYGNDTREP
jgi:hypothetical protein